MSAESGKKTQSDATQSTVESSAPESAAATTNYAYGRRVSRFAILALILGCLVAPSTVLRDQAGGFLSLRDPAQTAILLQVLNAFADPGRIIGGLMGALALFQILFHFRSLRGIALALGAIGAAAAGPIEPRFSAVVFVAAIVIEIVLGLVRVQMRPAAQPASE